MDTVLYLVRHVASSPDDIVNEQGLKQALSLADALSNIEVDLILSSPHKKAIATMKPFSKKAKIPIQIVEDLIERKVSETFIDNYLDVLKNSWIDFDFKLPNCESAFECQKRHVNILNWIVSNNKGKRILISSHGNAIALILNSIDNSFSFEDWKNLNYPDIKKIIHSQGVLYWDREFELRFEYSNKFR